MMFSRKRELLEAFTLKKHHDAAADDEDADEDEYDDDDDETSTAHRTVAFSLMKLLKDCIKEKNGFDGIRLHAEIAKKGLLEKNVHLATALITMYTRCSMVAKAHKLLEELPVRNVVSWNALIAGYTQQGQAYSALNCFESMRNEGVSPDAITFTCALKACSKTRDLDMGKRIHGEIVGRGMLGKDIVLRTALVNMYAKCGMLGKAREVLEDFPARDVVSWSALISGYVKQGKSHEALDCFVRMKRDGFHPNAITFICILRACGNTRDTEKGRSAHDDIVNRGFLASNIVLGAALVEMYVRCGKMERASQVLKELPKRNEVAWNTLIAGYAERGLCHEALECLERMEREEGITPTVITFICILKACGKIGAIDKGAWIHDKIVKSGSSFENETPLGNALIDMYAKCGVLAKARRVLEELPVRDVISWSALIGGYAQQGQGLQALACLERMESEGLSPNLVTFTCVLTACCHSGLVKEAEMLLENMIRKHRISPSSEHHSCMLVVYAYAGIFDRAMSVLESIAPPDCLVVWLALLGACRKWGNIRLGRLAFDQAMQLDAGCAAAYVLVAELFAAAGMEDDAARVETMRLKYAARCPKISVMEDDAEKDRNDEIEICSKVQKIGRWKMMLQGSKRCD